MYYIYKITNKINRKVYIGFTKDPKRRWKQHKIESKKVKRPLYVSMRKHGVENFQFEIIYESDDRKHTLLEMEPHFIREYNSYNKGYNCNYGGNDTNTDEMRENSRLRMQEDNPMYNEFIRNRVSLSLKGKPHPHTKEQDQKIRLSKLGSLNHNFGNPNAAKPLNELVLCQHCQKMINKGNYYRWHGDKCKSIG